MTDRPRIALSTGALRVPPTYFVLQHAARLADRYEFEVFARIADIRDDSLGIRVHDASPLPGRASYRQRSRLSLLAGSTAERQLRAFAPDLVHQHFGTWSAPAIAAARHGAVPMLTTVHGYDVFAAISTPSGVIPRWYARDTRHAYAASARILAVSEFLAGKAVEGGAPADRVRVHYQGVDTDFFVPDDSIRPPDDVPVIVFVGALSPAKGVRDLLESSLSLVASDPHRLVFVGAGPLEAELRERAAAAGHVEFAGAIPRVEVRRLIQGSRMLVLPAQEHAGRREAAGLVLLEAQSSGVPVVAYSSGGTSEMVRDGVTGRVVAERDTAALRAAIADLLRLPDADLALMRAAARQFVVSERSLAVSADQLAGHYDELLAS